MVGAADGRRPAAVGAEVASDHGVVFGAGAVADATVVFEVVAPEHATEPYPFAAPVARMLEDPAGDIAERVAPAVDSAAPAPSGTACFVTSDAFDGQKEIWLQQAAHLPRLSGLSTRVVTFTNGDGSLRHRADELGVGVVAAPLHVPAAAVSGDLEQLGARLVSSMRDAGWRVDDVEPKWARQVWRNITDALDGCDVVVFGNSRATSDAALVDAARAVGAGGGAVMDIPNLFPLVEDATVVVAPSHWAAHHTIAVLHQARLPGYARPAAHDTLLAEVSPRAAVEFAAQSEHQAAALPRLSPVAVVPPGTDFSRIDAPPDVAAAAAERRARRTPEDVAVVGIVARLSPEKSIGLLLHAVKHLREVARSRFRVVVVGEGPIRAALEGLAARLGVDDLVSFAGAQHGRALAAAMAGFDVAVSVAQMCETFTLANVEAMAAGVPLVSFANGGQGEYLVDRVTGVVLSRPSPTHIAQRLARVLDDPQWAAELGRRAQQMVRRHFSVAKMVAAYGSLYRCLIYCGALTNATCAGQCAEEATA